MSETAKPVLGTSPFSPKSVSTPTKPVSTPTKKPRKERVFAYIPVLHECLVAFFLFEVVYTGYLLSFDHDGFVFYASSLFAVAVAINVVKFVSQKTFPFLATKVASTKKINMRKFADQCWQFTIHISMTVSILLIFQNRGLMLDGSWYWVDIERVWASEPMQDIQMPPIKMFFLIQLSIWVYTCFSHVFLEDHHKDYYEMLGHHVATIFLVFTSYNSGFLLSGAAILLIHDVSDIPIDMMKMANYLMYDMDTIGIPITEGIFVTNLISWALLRLYTLPRYIIYQTFTDPNHQAACVNDGYDGNACLGARLGLLFLQVLHIYWFLLFIRLGISLLGESANKTGKSHYEGASDDEEHED